MVAGDVRRYRPAAHLEKRAVDDVGPAGSLSKMDPQPLFGFGVVFFFCEVFGNGLLIVFQDADAKLFFLLQQRIHVGAVVDANENQHGVERNGGKRVGGHAVDFARLALDSNDGHAGGEMAQGFAEFG